MTSSTPTRSLAVLLGLCALVIAGCGSKDKGTPTSATTGSTVPGQVAASRPTSFAQLATIKLGTSHNRVLQILGKPVRREIVKPFGVARTCFRYRGLTDGRVDERFEFRLCYDKRDRLSVKSTAPPG